MIVLATAAMLVLPGARVVGARQVHAPAEATYVVRPGDTLWGIASRIPGDRRRAVYEIRRANRLTGGTLRPGQVLKIPAR
ncbi:MAG: LysM peptidoglycan-binding domain-containing protein [Actinomycetota bacterium]